MYKIYINDTPLLLASQEALDALPAPAKDRLQARYPGKAKFLLHYIDMLEKSGRYESVTIYSGDLDQLIADFEGHFQLVEAAGGLVTNRKGAVLFIFRRKHWDLPKGKIDPGERPAEAALREVREETGLQNVSVGRPLGETYHTYRDEKGTRFLKRTYWFAMQSADEALTPQVEEDIEKAVWMSISDFFSEKRPVYGNIRELLDRSAVS